MADIKFVQVLQTLLNKTRAGRVGWNKTSSDTAFLAQLPGSAVGVRRIQGIYSVDILDASGSVVESATAAELQAIAPHMAIGVTVQELYEAAKQSATGADKVLGGLLDVLNRL